MWKGRYYTRLTQRVQRDINFLIMDYLISEGYPLAAQKFAAEANMEPSMENDSIRERVEIRNAIHAGNIQAAIEKINEYNPQVGHSESSVCPLIHTCYD